MLQSISSEKKLVKSLKNCFFGTNFHKNGAIMGHAPNETIFFGRNNKSKSSVFWNFLFYQNIICLDWVMNLFLSWVMFFVKKVLFPKINFINIKTKQTKSLGTCGLNSWLWHKIPTWHKFLFLFFLYFIFHIHCILCYQGVT